MSNLQHLAQLKEGRIYALCGAHRKRRDWEGVWLAGKVDCPKCIALLEEHSKRIEARERNGKGNSR